ncbi:hypothetical protein [Microbacterium sp. W4I20]|uniref:hypothetical protein n=1 Tax=Microbacterium sp. W4I20 TaxID=3042262 RepID=UPI0027883A73|nr:hypothetical protein [Microbacterium sp. W4I20]MDQ0726795.1 hypothetical protein [Microbacterium sp. W4I20]
MPITHLTGTSVFQSGTGNRTVTPNASAAVGDLMVLPVGFQDSSATTITTPAGWSVQKTGVLTGTLKTSLFTRTRQSGDTTWTYAPNQSVETSHLVLSIAGVNPASLIVGADGTRAASGATFGTTAPSITTTVAGARVFIIATERTTANETVEATVNNGFTKISHTFANGTSAESLFIGYKDMPTAGAVGATTVTFQNTHATNGYAVLIAVDPASVSQEISGTTVAASVTSAAFSVRLPISGLTPATSAASGSLSVVQAFSGSVSATSGTSAAVTGQWAISGAAQAASVAAGSMTATMRISGSTDVTSTATAAFTVTTAPIEFGGTVGVLSTSSASMTVGRVISGIVQVQSAAASTFSVSFPVAGTVAAVSGSAAEFTVGTYVPGPPVPKTRTLTGDWSASLTDVTSAHTLAPVIITHTLEDA